MRSAPRSTGCAAALDAWEDACSSRCLAGEYSVNQDRVTKMIRMRIGIAQRPNAIKGIRQP
jgi:hypothetical protein